MSEKLALDIETVNVVPAPDFDDPTDWEVFAIAVATREESDVFLRREWDPIDERSTIRNALQWIADRNPDEILTYNGQRYDFPILRHRSQSLGVADGWGLIVDNTNHIDLMRLIIDRFDPDPWPSLDDALAIHDIDPDPTVLGGSEITGKQMPELARTEVFPGGCDELILEAIRDYARKDVIALHPLDDRLRPLDDYTGPLARSLA